MKTFEKVIGYDDIKEELLKVADMFLNLEEYNAIGAYIPKGILIYGRPGMGKTLLANELAEICGCFTTVIRKNRNQSDFIQELRNGFTEAKENAPSIIILDDLDKYVPDEESKEEFYVVQACIDDIGNEDILVVATANNISGMPDSLLRKGRFDKQFELEVLPKGVSDQIIEKYTDNYGIFASNVNTIDVKKIFSSLPPASIITVLNNCRISMKYYKTDKITRSILTQEYLKKDGFYYDLTEKESLMENVAYHEAGHVVIRELIEADTVCFASVMTTDAGIRGIVCGTPKYDKYLGSRKITCESLAGMACEEQKFGYCTDGAADDIIDANVHLETEVRVGKYGLDLAMAGIGRDFIELSSRTQNQIEAERKRLYSMTKKALVDNWGFVEDVARKLLECDALLYSDIQGIRKKYSLRDFAV